MAKPVTIRREKPAHESLDYHFLKTEGIRLAQQYAGANWTDYNDHDPGVTLLEYLCYAITDVAYRTSFQIEDLLYAKLEGGEKTWSNAFYSSAAVLPCSPLTRTDYRRLLISKFEAIKNVWVATAKDSLYEGLLDIKLQLGEDIKIGAETIKEEVAEFMSAHRNLAEDINNIVILDRQYLSLKAELAIELDASEELVLATVLHDVEEYLNPEVKYRTKEELLEKGLSMSQIFDGPKPIHGFLLSDELPPLTNAVYISEIREVILAVPGVQAIHLLEVTLNGAVSRRDEIGIPPNTVLVLDPELKKIKTRDDTFQGAIDLIKLYKGSIQAIPNETRAFQMYHSITWKEKQLYRLRLKLDDVIPRSNKLLKDIRTYYSFQRYLPHVYGLGDAGIPQNADNLRKAQAKQLKAYLLIFEQFLSNYLAQLTQIRELFSIGITEEEEKLKEEEKFSPKGSSKSPVDYSSTYFVQLPSDIPDIGPIIRTTGAGEKIEFATKKWQEIITEFDDVGKRKNQFLDHLLARFGETFKGDILKKMYELGDIENLDNALIEAKTHFLQDYIQLSKYRGKGFDYRKSAWGRKENTTGFKRRICAMMNMASYEDRSLLPKNVWGLKSLKLKNSGNEKHRLPLKVMLNSGTDETHYEIKERFGGYALYFRISSSQEQGKLVIQAKTRSKCDTVKRELIQQLDLINQNSKGFFLLEHILLRPLKPKGWKLRFHIQWESTSPSLDIVFESLRFAPLGQLKTIGDSLLLIASNPNNFICLPEQKQKPGKWFIVLQDNKRPILTTRAIFKDKTQAESQIEAIADLIRQIKDQDGDFVPSWDTFNNWIDFKLDPIQQFQLSSDFYSHRVSLIVPNWGKSFQQQEVRSFFEYVVGEQLPAHLLADIHWFSVQQMTKFEPIYRNWLAEKSKGNPDLTALDRLSIELSELLVRQEDHRKTIKNLQATQSSSQVRKAKAIDQALFEEFRFDVYFQENNLQIIEGIGAKIEHVLKSAGINTWEKIVFKGKYEIEKVLLSQLGKKTLQIHRSKIESWITQAQYATNANWDELILLQKKLNKKRPEDPDSPAKIEELAKRHF